VGLYQGCDNESWDFVYEKPVYQSKKGVSIMKKEWVAVITNDMLGNIGKVIKEVEVEGDKLQFVKSNFPDQIAYTFRATEGGAQLAMQEMLSEPAVISLMR
jgi:hypothetical protein